MAKDKRQKIDNPFLTYGYVSPDYFCDREVETKDIVAAFHNRRNVTLIAQRRIGKTGLIKNVFHQIMEDEKDAVCVYIDIFSTRSLQDFVVLFGKSILEAAQTKGEKILQKAVSALTHCRPTFTIDPMTGAPSVTLNIVPSQEEQTLKEIFAYMQNSGHRFYVALDEFQQINQYPEKGTEALLRSYIQFLTGTSFIFSGSSRHLMTEMFVSAKRPFYQSTQIMELNVIGLSEYYDFADAFFKQRGGSISEEAFEALYNKFDGLTWYVQAMLNRLYEHYVNVDSLELIDATAHRLVEENTAVFQTLTSLLPDKQLSLMRAIAAERIVSAPNNGTFIRRHNLKAASSVSSALKALVDKELVYQTPKGYIVYDRILALWLRTL